MVSPCINLYVTLILKHFHYISDTRDSMFRGINALKDKADLGKSKSSRRHISRLLKDVVRENARKTLRKSF